MTTLNEGRLLVVLIVGCLLAVVIGAVVWVWSASSEQSADPWPTVCHVVHPEDLDQDR